MTKGNLTKSLNRTSDVLPNAPLRAKDWLANYQLADNTDKKVLAETWLTRFFQHTNGMSQNEYTKFCDKLFVRQIEWLIAMREVVGSDYFSKQDVSPQTKGLYDILWNPHTVGETQTWFRKLWLGSPDEKLEALLEHTHYDISIVYADFGNLVPYLANEALNHEKALDIHKEAAATLCCSSGEFGLRCESGLLGFLGAWQEIGFFCHYALTNKTQHVPTVELAKSLADVVNKTHVNVFLNNAPRYLRTATFKNSDGYEYIQKESLMGLLCDARGEVVPYYVLSTWLPEHQGYLNACNATNMSIEEACQQLCIKMQSSTKSSDSLEIS